MRRELKNNFLTSIGDKNGVEEDMVNFGIIGDIGEEIISLLKLFVKNLNQRDNPYTYTLIKTDFNQVGPPQHNYPRRVSPSRVLFREDHTKKAHTIIATGGELTQAERKGMQITISRITTKIILFFSLEHDLGEQIVFFNDTKFLPEKIDVCINRSDVLFNDDKKLEEINVIKDWVINCFKSREITINSIIFLSTATEEGIEKFIDLIENLINDNPP